MRTFKRKIKAMLPAALVEIRDAAELFRDAHGAYPNLLFPKTFNEKVMARGLLDRNPLWTRMADKFAVRSYVEERMGASLLTDLYWVTQSPEDIPFDDLPTKFVVKPTHGAGWVKIVKDKSVVDPAEIVALCREWLAQDFYKICHERVYKGIPPRILVEEFIDDGSGEAPVDYKFFVFHGRVQMIGAIFDRFGAAYAYHCDRDWRRLPVELGYEPDEASQKPTPRPARLDELVSIAETLAGDLDFIRVDLYETPTKIYFGELTTTPGAGLLPFHPPSFDRHLGSLW